MGEHPMPAIPGRSTCDKSFYCLVFTTNQRVVLARSATRTDNPDGSRRTTASRSICTTTRGPTVSPIDTIVPSTIARRRSWSIRIESTFGNGSLRGGSGRPGAAGPGRAQRRARRRRLESSRRAGDGSRGWSRRCGRRSRRSRRPAAPRPGRRGRNRAGASGSTSADAVADESCARRSREAPSAWARRSRGLHDRRRGLEPGGHRGSQPVSARPWPASSQSAEGSSARRSPGAPQPVGARPSAGVFTIGGPEGVPGGFGGVA